MPFQDDTDITLKQYFETIVVRNKLLSPRRIYSVRWAIRKLCEFQGRDVKCRDVDQEMLNRFADTMRQKGYKIRSRGNAADDVRAIVRRWSPTAIQLSRDTNPLLGQVYRRQYEPIKIRTASGHTKRLYRISLAKFDEYLGRDARLSDLNDLTVSAFASWRLDHGLAKKTVNRDLANILAIWRWLIGRHRRIRSAPNVALEIVPKRTPLALMPDEIAHVYAAIDQEWLPVGDLPGPIFWRALLLVIWDSAERIGAVRGLTWDRVDLERGYIRFAPEDRKGGAEDNVVKIAPDTCEALRALRRSGAEVFPWPYDPTHIYYRLGRIMKRAGLPDDRAHKFHIFRKTVASHYEAAGGNATALLKHSARKVTEAYLDPRIVKIPGAVDLLARPSQFVVG